MPDAMIDDPAAALRRLREGWRDRFSRDAQRAASPPPLPRIVDAAMAKIPRAVDEPDRKASAEEV